jgi:peptidoglycan/xylan/chitin deacetylase (PgdA/CDA1 family)
MNADERRQRNIERYEARVKKVKRIKRVMACGALAVVVGITAIVWGVHRGSEAKVQGTAAAENRTADNETNTDPAAAASSVAGTSSVSRQTDADDAVEAHSVAGTSGSEGSPVSASSEAQDAEAASAKGFNAIKQSLSAAALAGEKALTTPKYIWAIPKGATGGTVETAVPENDPSLQEGTKKIIYLTFDDGPGKYTEAILDMLAKHDVKATFFVTSQFPEYISLLKREADEGHSIAVHSYSHDYHSIYSSSQAFWDDFEKMQQVIEQQTGYRTELMRFPGGSSNTISKFNPGIMTELTQEAEQKGYIYIDWNASSGDAEVHTSVEATLANSKKQCGYSDTSVLLCHDIKETTIAAIDAFITWGEQNGYTFLPMSPFSKACHQQINN